MEAESRDEHRAPQSMLGTPCPEKQTTPADCSGNGAGVPQKDRGRGGVDRDWLKVCTEQLYPSLMPHAKMNSNCIQGLHGRADNKNCWKKTHDAGPGNDFLDLTPKVQATEENIDKWKQSVTM